MARCLEREDGVGTVLTEATSACVRPARDRTKGPKARSAAGGFVRIAGGQDGVKGRIFRIGHMGTVSDEEIAGGIATVERVLKMNGAPVKAGVWLDAWNAKMG